MRRLVCFFVLLVSVFCQEQTGAASANSCFCKLSGVLEDCPCSAGTIDQFNSQLHPSLIKLLETEYFRYFQVDFHAPCKWGWDAQCSSPNCAVDTCEEKDLLQNPEKFTGYSGEAAHRVWNTIYNEMCFHPETADKTLYLTSNTAKSMCLEKRAFYKLVSGLHSSIAVHLCSKYLLKEGESKEEAVWGRNYAEFRNRFSPSTTNDEGPERLKNIYFLYLVELRALHKIAQILEGLEGKEAEFKTSLEETLKNIEAFPSHFDESELFKDDTIENQELRKNYKQKFMEISEMMDCLGCERCKVWGKLQVTGVGTALKILFTPLEKLELTKHEIVALFNSFGRHSTSISELEEFRISELLPEPEVLLF